MVIGTRVDQFFDFDGLQPYLFVAVLHHQLELVDTLILFEHVLVEHLLLQLEQLLVFAVPFRQEARLLLEGVHPIVVILIDFAELVVYRRLVSCRSCAAH